MVSSIGSTAGNILQLNNSLFSTGNTSQASNSFEDLIGTGKINEENSSSQQTASIGGSSNSNSEMDLNNDGQVTIDEIIKYTQMQMQEQMSEQMSADEGTSQMAQDNKILTGVDEFKNKIAANAYGAIQNSMFDTMADILI